MIFRSKHTLRQMPDQIQAKFVGWAHQMTGTIWLQEIIMINMWDKYFTELQADCLRALSKASASYFCEQRTQDWWLALWNQSDLLVSYWWKQERCQCLETGQCRQLASCGAVLFQNLTNLLQHFSLHSPWLMQYWLGTDSSICALKMWTFPWQRIALAMFKQDSVSCTIIL